MPEVSVLVENLTGLEFKLLNKFSQAGKRKASCPEVLSRAIKLEWNSDSSDCSFALEFRAQASGGYGEQGSVGGTSFVLAARLPGPTKDQGGGWFSQITAQVSQGFISSNSESEKGFFSAVLKGVSSNEPPADLTQALAQAPAITRHGSSGSCEWLAVRMEAEVLEVRLRLLPSGDVASLHAPESGGELPAELAHQDEDELRRLAGYREVLTALDLQASELAAVSEAEPMDLQRLCGLPEQAKVDLALAFLVALLDQRRTILEACSKGGSPVASGNGGSQKEGTTTLQAALDGHASACFTSVVKLLGFGDKKREAKIAGLATTYLTQVDQSNHPKLKDLARSVRTSLDGEKCGVWSAECWWEVGGEDVTAPWLSRIMLFERGLAASREEALEGLSSQQLWCEEDCCLTYASPDEQTLGVLYREGSREKVLAHLDVSNEDDLLVPPSAHKVLSLQGHKLPRTWLLAREFLAMQLGAGGGHFDARSRVALQEVFRHLGVPARLAACWEAEIGGALFEALEASTILEAQKSSRNSWKKGKVAMAAAGGGLLLAVTGGLAAPVVAGALGAGAAAVGGTAASAGAAVGLTQAGLLVGGAITGVGVGLGAVLSSLGTAGAVALFGATGAGMTGWKMSRRWGDIKEFSFEPLQKQKRTVEDVLDVDDPEASKMLDDIAADSAGVLTEDVAVPTVDGGLRALRKGSEIVRRQSGIPGSASGSNVVRYHIQHEVDQAQRSVHLTLFVSGWIQEESDFCKPWAEAAKVFFPKSGHVALQWETKELLDMSAVFSQMVAQEVASQTASFWFKSTAITGAATVGVAGSLAAMTVAWPVWIVSSMAGLDNAWLVCVERARLAGKCLAHALADRHAVGQRPVTLIGHSMGARLLVYCLCELFDMGEFNVVDDVVLLGAPVTSGASKWRKVRAVASGRVVNGYLKNDWVLAFLFRYLEWGLSVAGLSEVQVPGIENVNLDGLGITGHNDYPRHVANILARMRIGEQPPRREGK